MTIGWVVKCREFAVEECIYEHKGTHPAANGKVSEMRRQSGTSHSDFDVERQMYETNFLT